jgi:hypothetical protein
MTDFYFDIDGDWVAYSVDQRNVWVEGPRLDRMAGVSR